MDREDTYKRLNAICGSYLPSRKWAELQAFVGELLAENKKLKEKLQPKSSCEWKVPLIGGQYEIHTKCGEQNINYSGDWDYYKFCPYCGHEIKALEK